MSYRVKITETAKQDSREIAFHIAQKSMNKEIAGRFVNELRKKCLCLKSFPDMGAMPKDYILRSTGYRFIVHKDYLIFYLINEVEKEVDVLAIFNAKKDYMRVLRKFV